MSYNINNHSVIIDIVLIEDYPTKIAVLFINDKVDVEHVLIDIPKLNQHFIGSDLCNGVNRKLALVCLFYE